MRRREKGTWKRSRKKTDCEFARKKYRRSRKNRLRPSYRAALSREEPGTIEAGRHFREGDRFALDRKGL